MFGCCTRQKPLREPLDQRQFQEAEMDVRVLRHWQNHHVRRFDYFLNGVMTVVGIAMAAFAIAMILLTHSTYSWSTHLLPFYVLYGGVGVLGCGLTVLSIKWMIQSCQRSIDYDRWANE